MAFNLNDLGQVLNAGAGAVNNFRQQRTLADLGTKLQTGDYKTAAQTALAVGDVDTGLKLLSLGQKQDELRQQKEADASIAPLLGGVTPNPQPMSHPSGGDGLPRGLRNMNPGNIEAGRFAQSQPGFIGSDGRFAKFDTLEHGVGAQAALLGRYADKGINTVAGVINRWAPQAENGAATGNYAKFVARKIGVDPNEPIDLSNPETRTRLAYAMGEFENGRPIAQQGGGQPVQVADASGRIPQSAGGGDQLQARLENLTRALAIPNISASAKAAIQAQIENTRNMISRSDKLEERSLRRQDIEENKAIRRQQLDQQANPYDRKLAEERAKNTAEMEQTRAQSGRAAEMMLPHIDRAEKAYETLAKLKAIGPVSASGPMRTIGGVFGSDAESARQDYEAAAKELELSKAQISMKGQGQITESERKILGLTLPRLDAARPETGIKTLKMWRALAEKSVSEWSSVQSKNVPRDNDNSGVLGQARDAISKGAPRDAVLKRLQENGIDTSGF